MVKLDFNLERDVPELTGKILLITGGKLGSGQSSDPSIDNNRLMVLSGTNGLGAATAKMLATRNPAKIYITGRNEAAAQQVISDIQSTSTTVTWIHCDHASLASVKEAADQILTQESRLDVLIANAGISEYMDTSGQISSMDHSL